MILHLAVSLCNISTLHDSASRRVSVQHQGLHFLHSLGWAGRVDILNPQARAVAAHVEEDVSAGAGRPELVLLHFGNLGGGENFSNVRVYDRYGGGSPKGCDE